jgi:hypothetical protein
MLGYVQSLRENRRKQQVAQQNRNKDFGQKEKVMVILLIDI